MQKNKNRLSFQAQLSRHPHDLSAPYDASLTTGQIIPQWFDIAQPGDKYIMKPTLFARFQNVVKAFLGEVDLSMGIYFVPLQMLYTPFGQIFTQTNDVISSTFKTLANTDSYPMLDIYNSIASIPPRNFYQGNEECVGKEFARLFDALNYNPYAVIGNPQRSTMGFTDDGYPIQYCQAPNVSPWLFAAYQAIYQKKFRNEEFEKFDIQAFNIDQYFNSDTFTNDQMLRLRYCQRSEDYFTKVRVSPIASAINKLSAAPSSDNERLLGAPDSTFDNLIGKINNWLGTSFNTNRTYFETPHGVSSISSENLDNGLYENVESKNLGGISAEGGATPVGNIRAAFALDKFLRVYGRAGKTYDDQILAHFGVKIPHDVKHDLTEIATFHAKLGVEPIYSTATIGSDAVGSSVLGDVGGQGSTSFGPEHAVKFTAPVHGVIMILAWAKTRPRYYNTFSKLHFLGSRIDFPIPEFDKLGAQPLYGWEYSTDILGELVYMQKQGEDVVENTLFNHRAGWQNRYQQFKEKYPRCSFIYAPAFSDSDYNIFEPWILSRSAFLQGSETVQGNMLFESPKALSHVMDVEFDPYWSNDYFTNPHLMLQTDPILTDFYCDCTKVSWMSPTGEPDM